MLLLAVFLGNPGAKYRNNRHNAGRLLADKLCFYNDLSWKKKFSGSFAVLPREKITGTVIPELPKCYFLIPETFMNLSGNSVRLASGFHSIPPKNIIAVHDELELPLGYLSLKFGGGLGGHNGLRSIKENIGTADFWRLRIGIGRPPGREPGYGGPPVKGIHEGGDGEVAQWVLSNFNPAEKEQADLIFTEGASLLVHSLSEEPESLLPEWKKKRVLPD